MFKTDHFPMPALVKNNMTPATMEALMENRALPERDRVAIRNGYRKLVELGWPGELLTLSTCVEADRRLFERWAGGPTLFGFKTKEILDESTENTKRQWIFQKTAADFF